MKKAALLLPVIGLMVFIFGCSTTNQPPADTQGTPTASTNINTPATTTTQEPAMTQTVAQPTPEQPLTQAPAQTTPELSPPQATQPVAASALMACASTAQTKPEKVGGFTTDMFTSPLTAARTPTQGVKTGTRTFSLADYADAVANPIKDYSNPVEKTTLKEDLFYETTLSGPDAYTGDFTGKIQICDGNNMTSVNNDLAKDLYPVSSKESSGFSDSILVVDSLTHGLPTEPGDYRIDGYLYANGKWTLTDRIDKITFTR